jgi:peptide/nickel transport system permease protein
MTELSPSLLPEAEISPASLASMPSGPPNRALVLTKDVLRSDGAKAGLLWILLLAFFAIFAPFLASTHPLLMKAHDHWSSPLLEHLTPPDVILQIVFWAAVALLFFRQVAALRRLFIWLAILVVSIPVCLLVVHPPALINYDSYRAEISAGNVQHIVYMPVRFSPDDHSRDQQDVRFKAPSGEHWLGTTADSADLFSNLIYASRIALSIGFISTGIAVVIGVFIGGLMGYFGGIVDLLGMRLVEIFDAIPTLLLLLCFVAAFPPPNLYLMMTIIGLTGWVGYATFVRAEFLSLRDRDFVHAARAAGLPLHSILFRHMLPNGITPVIVSASFGVASAILTESTLSFLGIGLPNEASWGGLLNQALGEGGSFYWWIAMFPGMAIFLTVFAYNLIGEALRDALDPRLLKR